VPFTVGKYVDEIEYDLATVWQLELVGDLAVLYLNLKWPIELVGKLRIRSICNGRLSIWLELEICKSPTWNSLSV
jgi:hypothetical protein